MPAAGARPQPLRLVKTGGTIQVAPGQQIDDVQIPREEIPRYAFCKLMRLADGTYTPVLQSWSQTIRLGEDFASRLGLDISYNTMRRLIEAEFIAALQIAPSTYLIDLDSLYNHIEAVKDREFWTPERRKQYIDALR